MSQVEQVRSDLTVESQYYPPPPPDAVFTPGPYGNNPPEVWVRVGNLEFMWRMRDPQGVFHVREASLPMDGGEKEEENE